MSTTADAPRRHEMHATGGAPRHSLLTRLFHGTLALTIIVQLLSSLVMRHAWGDHPGNIFFPIHEYSGMLALALAFLFWLNIAGRKLGTAPGALLPWFSAARRRALRQDVDTYLRAARNFSLPPHDEHAPLPSAIHGLGLLLISYMAVSGTFWYVMSLQGLGRNVFVHLILDTHAAFGNLAWLYLFGHAALGLLHHVTRNQPLSVMWSLRG
jgi:cytochrome b561